MLFTTLKIFSKLLWKHIGLIFFHTSTLSQSSMQALSSLKLSFFYYQCHQESVKGLLSSLSWIQILLFKKVLQFYLELQWPTAYSKFLFACWVCTPNPAQPKLKSLSSSLQQPVCLPVNHILVLQSSHSFTRALISQCALSPISATLVQNHYNLSCGWLL